MGRVPVIAETQGDVSLDGRRLPGDNLRGGVTREGGEGFPGIVKCLCSLFISSSVRLSSLGCNFLTVHLLSWKKPS